MRESQRLWFRAKQYGWGWYPITWEGWAVTLGWTVLFVCAEIWFIGQLSPQMPSSTALLYFGFVCAITGALIWVCYKTGEKPGWRWGGK